VEKVVELEGQREVAADEEASPQERLDPRERPLEDAHEGVVIGDQGGVRSADTAAD
jgi:hypothetical protein